MKPPMLIPSAVLLERSSSTHVTRGKVWAVLQPADCLRDVLTPRETVPDHEGPLVWILQGALEAEEEMPSQARYRLYQTPHPNAAVPSRE